MLLHEDHYIWKLPGDWSRVVEDCKGGGGSTFWNSEFGKGSRILTEENLSFRKAMLHEDHHIWTLPGGWSGVVKDCKEGRWFSFLELWVC